MSSRNTRGGGTENGTAKISSATKKQIELIKEATGAAEEDITNMLAECNYDVNETTHRLIDNPFSPVQSKKTKRKKKEEERRKDGSKVLEVRRPAAGAAGRGRTGRGQERAGPGIVKSVPPAAPQKPPASEYGVPSGAPPPPPPVAPVPEELNGDSLQTQPSPQKSLYSKAPGQNYFPPPPPQTEGTRPVGTTGSTMADLFKRPPGTASTPPQPFSSTPPAVNPSDQGVKPVAPPSPIGPVKPPATLDTGGSAAVPSLQPLPATDISMSAAFTSNAPSTSTTLNLSSEDTSGPVVSHVGTSHLATSTATVDVPVSAPARPSFQPNNLQASTGRSNVWKAAGPSQQSLAGSLMSAIGAGNSQSVKPADPAVLAAPSTVASSTAGVVADLHDAKSSVILPPSAQVAETERNIRLKFGQFSIGTDFSSSLSAALSIDQPEQESSALGQSVGTQERHSQPAVSSTPMMFKTTSGTVDYNSNARAYSAFSQPTIQPPPPKSDNVLPDATAAAKATESAGHSSSAQYYGATGQNPQYQQYLSSQHSSSHYPSSQYQQYDSHGLDSHSSHASAETIKPTTAYDHHSSYSSYQAAGLKTATDYSTGKYSSHQSTQAQPTVPTSVATTESATGTSTTPATTQLQPHVPQMQAGAYTNPAAAMPPGMAQYGHMYAQYPLFNMNMPPSYYPMPPSYSPYPPQGAAFGAPHQNSSTYHGTSSYPSHANPATAPRFPPYTPGMSAGTSVGFGKDKEGSLYAPQSQAQQLQQGVPRDNLYSYSVPGQGYQGYGGHSSQYSSYAMSQYGPNPYSQMPQGGGPGQVNSYKLQ